MTRLYRRGFASEPTPTDSPTLTVPSFYKRPTPLALTTPTPQAKLIPGIPIRPRPQLPDLPAEQQSTPPVTSSSGSGDNSIKVNAPITFGLNVHARVGEPSSTSTSSTSNTEERD